MKSNGLKFGLIGLAGGMVGGMFGVGGGIIMIPLLTWQGFTQKEAQGTSLAATIPLAIVSGAMYFKAGSLDLISALPMATGGVIGAFIGSGLVKRFTNRLLYRLFGLMLLIIAIRHAMTVLGLGSGDDSGQTHVFLAFLAGVLAGCVSGFFGVGGGVVFVPSGVQLLGLGEKAAQGASFVAIIPTALVGFLRYHASGEVRINGIGMIIMGAVLGSFIGSAVAVNIKDTPLALCFSAFIAIIALKRLIGRNPQG